jgi:hypothetical protein
VNWTTIRTLGSGLAAGAVLAGILLPSVASADVERIREMALELEQKLNKQRYDVMVRGEKPTSDRIYKDYDFILADSKVSEVAEADGDPRSEALRLYLIQAIVDSRLAAYVDGLNEFEQTTTADLDGKKLLYSDLLALLARTKDGGERRKIASVMPPLIETSAVFRNQIVQKRTENYKAMGFEDYAAFFAAREGLDLDALDAQAKAFLAESQPAYDVLFEAMAQEVLGTEGRKVRFQDLPYLTSGCDYAAAFPAASATRRLRALFTGLGVDLTAQSNLSVDTQERKAKAAYAVVPVLVPGDVEVGIRPLGCDRDNWRLAYAVGEAQVYTLSKQTAFETAYLVNQAAQAALAWLPRLVQEEPAWIKGNMEGSLDPARYLKYRQFVSLFEARVLAAITQFEIAVYREQAPDPDKVFRDVMAVATGVRVSSGDAQRSAEFLTQLQSASRFHGLLLAAGVRKHLRDEFGEDWYSGGKAGAFLKGLWQQGGTLTPGAIATASGLTEVQLATYLDSITSAQE